MLVTFRDGEEVKEMAEKVEPGRIPRNAAIKLALLYVRAQDLTGKTPTEVNRLFLSAYNEIFADQDELFMSGWY
jgi:hypothetical protein